jgi:hypothetical protein
MFVVIFDTSIDAGERGIERVRFLTESPGLFKEFREQRSVRPYIITRHHPAEVWMKRTCRASFLSSVVLMGALRLPTFSSNVAYQPRIVQLGFRLAF